MKFPISRDPPEGGTASGKLRYSKGLMFPISRDPPEGGTRIGGHQVGIQIMSFQFLGIPPKGELLFIPDEGRFAMYITFPISRDPPEGGTTR